MDYIWYAAAGAITGAIIMGIIWVLTQEKTVRIIGELRVEPGEEGGTPLLYLAMNSDAYAKIKKGKIVSFYVQDAPPKDI